MLQVVFPACAVWPQRARPSVCPVPMAHGEQLKLALVLPWQPAVSPHSVGLNLRSRPFLQTSANNSISPEVTPRLRTKEH